MNSCDGHFHHSTKVQFIHVLTATCRKCGPNLYIMFIRDLKPQDVLNYLLKYADDVSFLCPQNSRTP